MIAVARKSKRKRRCPKPRHVCKDCGRVTSDLYWTFLSRYRMKLPRCADCHEQAVRRATEEDEPNLARMRWESATQKCREKVPEVW